MAPRSTGKTRADASAVVTLIPHPAPSRRNEDGVARTASTSFWTSGIRCVRSAGRISTRFGCGREQSRIGASRCHSRGDGEGHGTCRGGSSSSAAAAACCSTCSRSGPGYAATTRDGSRRRRRTRKSCCGGRGCDGNPSCGPAPCFASRSMWFEQCWPCEPSGQTA
jgi:hypothetical protein